jgi:hypothetical protein
MPQCTPTQYNNKKRVRKEHLLYYESCDPYFAIAAGLDINLLLT